MGHDHTNKLRASDYTVRPIPYADGAALVARLHYTGSAGKTATHCHGMFDAAGTLVGAALWLPTTPGAARTVSDDWRGVLALFRLVVSPHVPANAASYLIGRSLRLIKRDKRWHTLLTYADQRQGHTGSIYRATNWTYLGETAAQPWWVDGNGNTVSRKATRSRSYAEMRDLGYRIAGRSKKHKFVMRLR